MFCYQSGFNDPTRVVSKEQFWALVRASETVRKVREGREALTRGDKATYDRRKKGLPLMIFIGTFDVSERTIENKRTGEKRTLAGRWRNQKHVKLNGLVVADYDHLEGDVRKLWEAAYSRLSNEDKARILLVYVTPSGEGLKVVFMADVNAGNLIDNQKDFSAKLGLPLDESCKDGCRGAFMTTEEDIILLDERIFSYENTEYGERYNEAYQNTNRMNDTNRGFISNTDGTDKTDNKDPSNPINPCSNYHGVPYAKIVEAWLGDKKVEPGDRHRTSLVLADHLRYITDNDPVLIEQILRQTPFVKDIVEERNEDVAQTVKSAQGYEFLKGIPKRMKDALKASGAVSQSQLS